MDYLIGFFRKIKKSFNPEFIYTLDRSYGKDDDGCWLFKSYGSHIYVKKNWQQISDGNFLNSVNPRDISFIAEFEAREKVKYEKFNISEEARDGKLVLVNHTEKIRLNTCELLSSHEFLDKTSSVDIARIAYKEGVKKGREISSLIEGNFRKKRVEKKPVLKLIK